MLQGSPSIINLRPALNWFVLKLAILMFSYTQTNNAEI
jgi:hypothetical protein